MPYDHKGNDKNDNKVRYEITLITYLIYDSPPSFKILIDDILSLNS